MRTRSPSWRWAIPAVLLALGAAALVELRGSGASPLLTLSVGAGPVAVALDPTTGQAVVASGASDTVSLFDVRAGVPSVRTVTVAPNPRGVAMDSRTQQAFVVNGAGVESVVDLRTATVRRTVVGLDETASCDTADWASCAPLSMAVDEPTRRVFVEASLPAGTALPLNAVDVLDATSGALLHTIRLGHGSGLALALAPQVGHLFVTNRADGTVSMLDAASGRILRTMAVGAQPVALASDARSGHLFVLNNADNSVSVLDARSGTVLRTVTVGADPTGVAVDEQARRVMVSNTADGTVSVLDARSGTVLRTVAVGPNPRAVVVEARTGRAFVINRTDYGRDGAMTANHVSVLDVRWDRLVRRWPVGRFALALALDPERGRLVVVDQAGSPAEGSRGSGPDWTRWVPVEVRRVAPWFWPQGPSASPTSAQGSVTVLDTAHL